MEKMKVALLRENAKMPRREHETDAGADVFLSYSEELIKNHVHPSGSLEIYPNSSIVVPTGIKLEVPPGYKVEVKNKSSIAAGRHLLVGACVIDSGYSGELFVNLHNVGVCSQYFREGDKVAQIVVGPIETPEFESVKEDELYKNMNSDRGDGGFGSTGER